MTRSDSLNVGIGFAQEVILVDRHTEGLHEGFAALDATRPVRPTSRIQPTPI